jgi:hypothetical protein
VLQFVKHESVVSVQPAFQRQFQSDPPSANSIKHWYGRDVRRWLNDVLPHRQIEQGDRGDLIFCPWPARSPDLTFCDYFLWGNVKDKVFVLPLPASIPDLQSRITATVEIMTPDMPIKVWQELDYRLDVCHVTKGAYIKHL